MGDVRRFVLMAIAAAILAAAFASAAAAQELLPGLPLNPPPPELTETVEIIGWGVVVLLAWMTHPLVGLSLYIAALALVQGDRDIVMQTATVVLFLFAPIYALIRAGTGGRRK